MDITIKRSEWLRGEGAATSKLLREADQKMCCVGFACLAYGINREEILGCSGVSNVNRAVTRKLPSWYRNDHSSDLADAYRENDEEDTLAETRERRLVKLFERNGDNLIFVD
jgi:hypothetical protein